MYNFDEVINRYGTNCAKWDEADELYGKGLIHLAVADMDFKSPKPVIDAMQKSLNHGVFGYTVLNDKYYNLTQDWMRKRYNWGIDKEWIVFSPRIGISVSLIIQTLTEEGDGIVIQSPSYSPLRNAVLKNNRKLITNPLKLVNDKYEMDFDDLEKKIDDSTKILILCSPHNPVARVWTIEELQRLGEICIKNDLIIISDEIHSDILYRGKKHTPIASISHDIANRTIICNSITKTFNVPGLMVSNLIIPNEEIRKSIEASLDTLGIHNPNVFCVQVLEAAYSDYDEWIDEMLSYIESNFRYFKRYIEKYMPELRVIEPEGTYLVWVDCRGLNIDEREINDWLTNKGKVGVYLGSVFGKEGKGFIRINLATARKTLEAALERMYRTYPI